MKKHVKKQIRKVHFQKRNAGRGRFDIPKVFLPFEIHTYIFLWPKNQTKKQRHVVTHTQILDPDSSIQEREKYLPVSLTLVMASPKLMHALQYSSYGGGASALKVWSPLHTLSSSLSLPHLLLLLLLQLSHSESISTYFNSSIVVIIIIIIIIIIILLGRANALTIDSCCRNQCNSTDICRTHSL